MIQVRNSIFETNSSSTHCLVISKPRELYEDYFKEYIKFFQEKMGKKIVFGKNPYSVIQEYLHKDPSIDENTDFQIKADMLYFSMYVWTECGTVGEFLVHKKQLVDKLTELGFEVEFREDPKVLDEIDYHKYDVDENMWDEMWSNIDEVMYYLFNDHVLYYTWCDECCEECPKDIEDAIYRFEQYELNGNEEMIVHHYR